MACFLVPVAEAIAVTIAKKVVAKKEKNHIKINGETVEATQDEKQCFSWSRKLGWLDKMLWGGSFLLLIEHIWHGEIVPWPPFLTAMTDPAATTMMLNELAIVGTAMAVFVTAVWGLMVLVMERRGKLSLERAKAEK